MLVETVEKAVLLHSHSEKARVRVCCEKETNKRK